MELVLGSRKMDMKTVTFLNIEMNLGKYQMWSVAERAHESINSETLLFGPSKN